MQILVVELNKECTPVAGLLEDLKLQDSKPDSGGRKGLQNWIAYDQLISLDFVPSIFSLHSSNRTKHIILSSFMGPIPFLLLPSIFVLSSVHMTWLEGNSEEFQSDQAKSMYNENRMKLLMGKN